MIITRIEHKTKCTKWLKTKEWGSMSDKHYKQKNGKVCQINTINTKEKNKIEFKQKIKL